MPGNLTTIHPFPELRALAEEEARDIWTRHVRLFREHLPEMEVVADPHDASDGFAVTVAAQVERLCDLTRPASRDAVARLVAGKLGGTPRPDFFLGKSSGLWWLGGGPCFAPWEADDPEAASSGAIHIPALAGVTDPAEALALIVRHLWPKEQP